jgi:Ca-activated chloride channel family protein
MEHQSQDRLPRWIWVGLTGLVLMGVGACARPITDPEQLIPDDRGLAVNFWVGSALGPFCSQVAVRFNQQQPTLATGEPFYLACRALGSGDVVSEVITLAQQLQMGSLSETATNFPTLISVDGEIYLNQLRYQMEQLYPGENSIPPLAETPLLAHSPMVFMTSEPLAAGLKSQDDLLKALVTADTHRDLDPASPAQPIYYVHTAPNKSNSGLQILVAQFVAVTGKPPEVIAAEDVEAAQDGVRQIQAKITRYGHSTSSLAKSMVDNGPDWASIASVYESSVIEANSRQGSGTKYVAVYPRATFTSNMRAIVPNTPWVSPQERAAAEQVIEYLRSVDIQRLAMDLGLRPGVPGLPLGPKFAPQFGVDPEAKYSSYLPPEPPVVEAMVKAWEDVAKKPSLVVIVVDSSGSMQGDKMPAVQSTLENYINSLRPQDDVALIDFDTVIRPPLLADGTFEGQQRGEDFISSLQVQGGTNLYDAALYARDWLRQNRRSEAINAVLVLTDGRDSGSQITLDQLSQELQTSSFTSGDRIAFFTVGYGEEEDFNPDVLIQIAKLNGGYYTQGDPQTIERLMADLQLEF